MKYYKIFSKSKNAYWKQNKCGYTDIYNAGYWPHDEIEMMSLDDEQELIDYEPSRLKRVLNHTGEKGERVTEYYKIFSKEKKAYWRQDKYGYTHEQDAGCWTHDEIQKMMLDSHDHEIVSYQPSRLEQSTKMGMILKKQ
ncbi:hypothetical protein ABLA30_03860 [Xenorhabdus nematophila]|uniref:hypothetical protein n=1 Tax=Xenorhabdus nematophila TaxID=628 RepID=UPI0032B74DDE